MNHKKVTIVEKCDLITEQANITGSCRVCMAQSTNMRDIFGVDSNITSRIEYCTGIKLSEHIDLPSQICDTCVSDLSVAHKFKTKCIQTDETLHKLILRIKVEVDDGDDFHGDDDDEKDFEVKKEEVSVKKENTKSKSRNKPSVRRKGYRSLTQSKKLELLSCETCQVNFNTRKEREEHNKKLHKDLKETFVCEICGKVFLHRASLFSHSRSHRPPRFACSVCDYITSHKHDLAKHVLIHTGNKRYQCEFCTASYYTSSNLTSHIRRYHERIKPFSCTICNMKFYDSTKLKRHIDSHNDVKRFSCEICHSCFTRRCYWKKHLQRQHNILIPAQRPGKQRVNVMLGENLVNQTANTFENS